MTFPRSLKEDKMQPYIEKYYTKGFYYLVFEENVLANSASTKLRVNLPQNTFEELIAYSKFDRLFLNLPELSVFSAVKWHAPHQEKSHINDLTHMIEILVNIKKIIFLNETEISGKIQAVFSGTNFTQEKFNKKSKELQLSLSTYASKNIIKLNYSPLLQQSVVEQLLKNIITSLKGLAHTKRKEKNTYAKELFADADKILDHRKMYTLLAEQIKKKHSTNASKIINSMLPNVDCPMPAFL